jgi:hypothetical protein
MSPPGATNWHPYFYQTHPSFLLLGTLFSIYPFMQFTTGEIYTEIVERVHSINGGRTLQITFCAAIEVEWLHSGLRRIGASPKTL